MSNHAQPVTFAEAARLTRELNDRLLGSRGRLWYEAYKRFLKRETPFIRTDKIIEEPLDWLSLKTQLGYLKSLGEMTHFDTALELKDTTPIRNDDKRRYIVSVRLGDLLTADQLLNTSYADLLKKACEEFGLDPCSLKSGLEGVARLVETQRRLPFSNSHCTNYVICSHPFQLPGEDVKRVPLASIWPGRRELDPAQHRNQGWICLLSIDTSIGVPNTHMMPTVNSFQNPEMRLLFIESLA